MVGGMELFFSRISGNSARAVFGLHEIGVDWTPRPVDPRAGETRRPEYLALNPMGKIPALKDGDFVLWESNAINWYAAETHPQAGLLPPTPRERAAVQRWLYFQTGHVSPACLPIFRARHPAMQAFWNMKPDPALTAIAEKELARFLPVLDAALVGKEWLEGKFSLADVAYAPHLGLLRGTAFDFGPYPHLAAWLDRLLARPAWKKAEALVFGSLS
jgi:glutathione S-transferase